jgi:YD repeat-containing protein
MRLPLLILLVLLLLLCTAPFAFASGSVPLASTGGVSGSFSTVSGTTGTWNVLKDGSVIATNAAPNGWNATLGMGSSILSVSAPGSATVGSGYSAWYQTSSTQRYSGDFDTVQPATSLFSGPSYPWQAAQPSSGGLAAQTNTRNGNKLTTLPIVAWTARGGMAVPLTLVHNSQSSQNTTLGPKWTHAFDLYLTIAGNGDVTLHWGDDRAVKFVKSGSSYIAPTGIYDTLIKNANNTYTLTRKSGVKYEFNTASRCTQITDLNSNTLTLAYSGNNLISVTDPSGRVISFSYTSNRITTITDPLNRQWTLAYNGSGQLTSVTYPTIGGQSYAVNFGYNSAHCLTSIQLPRGYSWTFGYNADNSLAWEKDPYNNQTSYSYTLTTATVTGPNGSAEVCTYDSSGRLTQWKDALNNTESYTYDTANNVTQLTDRRSKVWQATYDTQGNALTRKNPLNKTWTYTYNSLSRCTSVTDPLNHATTYGYDGKGNLTSITDALSHTWSYTVNADGLTTAATDPLNHTSSYTYDTDGNVETVTNALNQTWTYDYNLLGQVTSVTDPNTNQVTATYDAWQRLKTVVNPSGDVEYGYDQNDNVTSFTDGNNYTTTLTYDNADRLKTVTKPNTDALTYTYDATGKKGLLSSFTNGNNKTIT